MRSLFSIPRLFLSAGTAVILLVGSANTAAAGVDNQIYARLLNQYVADGVVEVPARPEQGVQRVRGQ